MANFSNREKFAKDQQNKHYQIQKLQMHRLIKTISRYYVINLYINLTKRRKSPGRKVLQDIIIKYIKLFLNKAL